MQRRLTFLAVGWILLQAVNGIAAPALSADQPIVYDHKTRTSIAEGNADLLTETLHIQADKIVYHTDDARVTLKDHVRLTHPKGRLIAQSGAYHHREQKLEAEDFRASIGKHGIQGQSLQGSQTYALAKMVQMDAHGLEHDAAGFHIKAQEAEIFANEKYCVLRRVTFYIGPVPVFYLPRYTLHYGHEEKWYTWHSEAKAFQHVRNDIFLNYGSVKPGIMFDVYNKRGVLFGGLLNYQSPYGNGGFRAARLDDRRYRGSSDVKNPQHWIEWRHQGHIEDRIDVGAQTELLRDRSVIQDMRPKENDGLRQHPDNFAEIAYRGDESVTSGLIRYRLNQFQHTQERLPEIRYEHLPVALGDSPLYHQFGAGFANLREKGTTGTNAPGFQRGDLSYGLSLPINVHPACTITPVASGRMIQYLGLDKHPDHSAYTRYLGQVGFDVRFRSYGDYDYQNDYWDIHNFRHLLQPVVQYRYMPHGHQGNTYIPAIDREAIDDSASCALQEIDLLNRRDFDDCNDMHLTRIGCDNTLFTYGYDGTLRKWLTLNAYQDVCLKRNWIHGKRQHTLSNTWLQGEWTPIDFLGFDQSVCVSTGEGKLRLSNTGITFKEHALWSVRIGYIYRNDDRVPTHQISLTGTYRIDSKNKLAATTNFDVRGVRFLAQSLTWTILVSETWEFATTLQWSRSNSLEWLFGLNLTSW